MAADADFALLTGNDVESHWVKAGGVIFRAGEQADGLFVIKTGYVRIQIDNRSMAELAAGDIFGEMALIDNEPRRRPPSPSRTSSLCPSPKSSFCFL